MSEAGRWRVMAVFAHPDDESIGAGGTLAALANSGARVQLLCATRGEVGGISHPSLATRETLPDVREQELRSACSTLGIEPPVFLGYRDSGLPGSEHNDDPASLAARGPDEVARMVARHIREFRPHTLITFDPFGVYGHPDHIAVHHAAREAFYLAGDPSYSTDEPDAARPHAPQRLLYLTTSRPLIRSAIDRMRAEGIDMSSLAGIELDKVGTPDDDIDIRVDIAATRDAKLKAIRCHATQMFDNLPWGRLPRADRDALMAHEHLVQAEPQLAGCREGTAQEAILG